MYLVNSKKEEIDDMAAMRTPAKTKHCTRVWSTLRFTHNSKTPMLVIDIIKAGVCSPTPVWATCTSYHTSRSRWSYYFSLGPTSERRSNSDGLL